MSQKAITRERILELHKHYGGVLKVITQVPMNSQENLSIYYTPGVAEPAKEIAKDKAASDLYSWQKKTVAVISDGTAVLGLGNVGPYAAMPVMLGKCGLLVQHAGLNAIPICLNVNPDNPQQAIETITALAPSFGGINLEDFAAPNCCFIEAELKKRLNIPVFHDDQHGTAIVVTAGLLNAVKIVHKDIAELTVVISGAGAAGSAITKMLHRLGVKEIYTFEKEGIITSEKYDKYNFLNKELCSITNSQGKDFSMAEAMKEADVFIGVSVPNIVTPEMVASMKKDAIIFAMANPIPEIDPSLAKAAGARIVGTGRSDYPNQINNVIAFPGIFKGALEGGATQITEDMKLAAAYGISSLISDDELSEDYIIPSPCDERVHNIVAKAVINQISSN